MSNGKIFAPMYAQQAVPSAVSQAGLTHAAGGSVAHSAGAAAAQTGHAAATAGMHGLATAATVAGTAVLAVGLAATAVVMTRAAMGGLRDFGESIVEDAAQWEQQCAAAQEWQQAVLAVVDVNARIAVLRAAGSRLDGGPGPDLPGPLDPAGRAVAELRRWCAETERRLEEAERRQAGRVIDAGMGELARRGTWRADAAADGLARWAEQARRWEAESARVEALAAASGRGGEGGDREKTAATVDRILGRTLPKASPEEAATLLEAAGKALSTCNAAAASSWLGELRAREQQVDAAVRRRRADIEDATRFLAGLRLDRISPELYPAGLTAPFADVAERLEAVAAGREPLTSELRMRAEDAVLHMQDIADQSLVAETLAAACTRLGYRVRRGEGAALMSLTLPEWDGDEVRFELAEGQVVATFGDGPVGDPATVVDAARLRRWRDDFDRVCGDVKALGLEMTLLGVVEPHGTAADTAAPAGKGRRGDEEGRGRKRPQAKERKRPR
ncbi:hypothetical protein [Actinomadura opuntiae]|uniref:hypothetical protein n=1 Tax=Actinomadura sp. OS1-43 TaxID=604315 RepID=UPI00255AA363|nr:hypothetical protein [Actinomadura sp. OS1-43]MDL4815010.1 hypothetical protein [Actinomadura sp. OS1-43]